MYPNRTIASENTAIMVCHFPHQPLTFSSSFVGTKTWPPLLTLITFYELSDLRCNHFWSLVQLLICKDQNSESTRFQKPLLSLIFSSGLSRGMPIGPVYFYYELFGTDHKIWKIGSHFWFKLKFPAELS